MTEDLDRDAKRDLVDYLAAAHPTVPAMRAIWVAAGGKPGAMPDSGPSARARWAEIVYSAVGNRLHPEAFGRAVLAAHPGEPTHPLAVLGWVMTP